MIPLWQRLFTNKQNVFFLCKRVSGGTSSCVTLMFQHHMYMFNMEYRHLLNVSVNNTVGSLSKHDGDGSENVI